MPTVIPAALSACTWLVLTEAKPQPFCSSCLAEESVGGPMIRLMPGGMTKGAALGRGRAPPPMITGTRWSLADAGVTTSILMSMLMAG